MAGIQFEKVVARQFCSLSVKYTTNQNIMHHMVVYTEHTYAERDTNYLFYFVEEL